MVLAKQSSFILLLAFAISQTTAAYTFPSSTDFRNNVEGRTTMNTKVKSTTTPFLPRLTDDMIAERTMGKTSRRKLFNIAKSSLLLLNLPLPCPVFAEDIVMRGYMEGPRGLSYLVMKEPTDADSPTPKRAQKVKALYTLYLNGFPQDDSDDKNSSSKSVKVDSSKGILGEKPFEFLAGVSQVIKGWDLSILDMRVGEARKLIVPSDLGYGEQGAGGKIPGGATLYFEVELVGIGEMAKIGPEQEKWLNEHPL